MIDTAIFAATAALAVALLVGLAVVAMKASAHRTRLGEVSAELQALRAEFAAVQAERIEARTHAEQADRLLSETRSERDAARADLVLAREKRAEAETQSKLDRQALDEIKKRMEDWEKTKAETLTHAKAAVLETATELSSKLLADHKKESEQAKKEAEERIKKTTEGLTQNFDHVAKSVKSLADRVAHNQESVETVRRALSSPGGAGYFAEIGLENTLKSFGLERGRDFVVQHSVDDGDGGRKKPDAVVFLPHDSVLVVDSKASKFLLDLAEAEGTDAEQAAYDSLARTMNQHLRDLASKDYRGAVIESYRAAGRGKDLYRVMNVMYLPNDAALEKLKIADPEFDRKAAKANIQLAGPTGLSALIAFARMEIDLGRQAENQEKIVEAVEALLESVAVVLDHAQGVGRGLKSSANAFANMMKSANARLLPRSRTLTELGVRPAKSKALPKHLPAFQVIDHSVIEGEAEEVPEDTGKVHRLETGAG